MNKLTSLVALAVAGYALNAAATSPTTTAPATTTTTPAATTTTAKPTTTTTAAATTPATTTTAPAAAVQSISGELTGLTATNCKIKDAAGKELTFNLGTIKSEGWKVGDKVTAQYDTKTFNLVDVKKN